MCGKEGAEADYETEYLCESRLCDAVCRGGRLCASYTCVCVGGTGVVREWIMGII